MLPLDKILRKHNLQDNFQLKAELLEWYSDRNKNHKEILMPLISNVNLTFLLDCRRKCREEAYIAARNIYYYIAVRKYPTIAKAKIAHMVNLKTHSSVTRALKEFDEFFKTYPSYIEACNSLLKHYNLKTI